MRTHKGYTYTFKRDSSRAGRSRFVERGGIANWLAVISQGGIEIGQVPLAPGLPLEPQAIEIIDQMIAENKNKKGSR